jgi:hypothetical protein
MRVLLLVLLGALICAGCTLGGAWALFHLTVAREGDIGPTAATLGEASAVVAGGLLGIALGGLLAGLLSAREPWLVGIASLLVAVSVFVFPVSAFSGDNSDSMASVFVGLVLACLASIAGLCGIAVGVGAGGSLRGGRLRQAG